MQGISLPAERLGFVEWQTSRMPISASLSLPASQGRDGGAATLIAIARRTMSAFHLIRATIRKTVYAVNVKFQFEQELHGLSL